MSTPPFHRLTIKKRDGRVVAFDRTKIVAAIMKAAHSVQGSDYRLAEDLADQVIATLKLAEAKGDQQPGVEQIQDAIEKTLIENGHARTAKAFILYRAERSRVREQKSEIMEWLGQALADPETGSSKLLPAKHHAVGKAITAEFALRRLLPTSEAEAHSRGDWYIHGLSDYAQTPHSGLVPLTPVLKAGIRQGSGALPPAQELTDLPAMTTAAVLGTASEAHAGIAILNFDSVWARSLPVEAAAAQMCESVAGLMKVLNVGVVDGRLEPLTASFHVGSDVNQAAREVTRALLEQRMTGAGQGPFARPHVVYVLTEGVNTRPSDPNFDLTELAMRVATARGGVDFLYNCPGHAVFSSQACLAVNPNENRGVPLAARISVNLPRLALRARRQGFETADLLQEALSRAAQHLHQRAQTLARRPSKAFRFLSGDFLPLAGETPRAEPWEEIWQRPRAAINLVGLAETLMVLSGQHHGLSPSAQAEGLTLIRAAGARAAKLNEEFDSEFILQGTPAFTAAQRFIRLDRREFGIIRGVTDRDHYTTGVAVPLPGAEHRATEAAYLPLLLGGSPCEAPAAAENLEAGLKWLNEGVQSGVRWLRFPARA